MVKLTAVPSNQNVEIDLNSAKKASYSFQEGDDVQETITKKHSDVRLRGTYNYTEGIAKEPRARVKVAKLNWVSGCVVKRTERFGKNLKLYADASGDRVNSNGKTYYKVSNVFNKGNFRA